MMTLAWILYDEDLFSVAIHLCWSQKTFAGHRRPVWFNMFENTSPQPKNESQAFLKEQLEVFAPLRRHKHGYHSLKILFTVSEFQAFTRNSSLHIWSSLSFNIRSIAPKGLKFSFGRLYRPQLCIEHPEINIKLLPNGFDYKVNLMLGSAQLHYCFSYL